jgi:hypothetical protein
LVEDIEKEAEFLAAHSELPLPIVKGVKSLNAAVREVSRNAENLKVLLPAELTVWPSSSTGWKPVRLG